MKYRVRYWTGPTRVQDYLTRAQDCPVFSDVMDGTEHIYFTVEAADEYEATLIARARLGLSFTRAEAL